MSLFAKLMRKQVILESPRVPALPVRAPAASVMPPAVPADAVPSARSIPVIPESHPAALRKSVIPESPYFKPYISPEDHSPEERAMRDEKVAFIRAVWEFHSEHGCPESRAVEAVAARGEADFPLLSTAGKDGASALRYNNYRNWLNGTHKKPGLGRLNDGSPDFRNADVLLCNYARGQRPELFGDPLFWQALRGDWFHGSQYLAKSYRHLRWKWELDNPGLPLPTLAQVRRRFRADYPLRMQILARKGENAYDQKIRSYIERDPDSIQPGEAWVADTKDLDFLIRVPADPADSDGKKLKSEWKTIRPKIVAILDVKSQFPVSIQLIDGDCSNAVIRNGFAAAVAHFGRPKIFLTDHGADYCKAGFGTPVVFTPDVSGSQVYSHSIMRELNVEHDMSIPYNARSKIVERFFREVAGYERDSRGYVGNKPEARPATADVWAKIKGREYLNSVDDACKWIAELVMIYLNTPSNGAFLHGLTPLQAFRPELRRGQPPLSEAEYFRAFRLPLQEPKKLDPRGPCVRLDGDRFVVIPQDRERAWKFDNRLVMLKTVLFDHSVVYLYSLDGAYIGEARITEKLPYFHAPAELLAERQKEISSERVMLRARIMDATGGWHLIDPQISYQMPREAFASPAPVKLLDKAMSVGGETHNPSIYILKSEEHPVCSSVPVIPESPKQAQEKKAPAVDPALLKSVIGTLTGEQAEPAAPAVKITTTPEPTVSAPEKIKITQENENVTDRSTVRLGYDF